MVRIVSGGHEDRQAAVNDIKGLKKEAESVAKRVKDSQPATGEVTQVVQHLQAVRTKAGSVSRSRPRRMMVGQKDVAQQLAASLPG
jgi:hypothetical protein